MVMTLADVMAQAKKQGKTAQDVSNAVWWLQSKGVDFSKYWITKPANTTSSAWVSSPSPTTSVSPTSSTTSTTATPWWSMYRGADLKSVGTQTQTGVNSSQWQVTFEKPTATPIDATLNQRWAWAKTNFWTDVTKYDARDDQAAKNIVASGQTPEERLASQPWFKEASPQDQANTLDAIKKRIWAFGTTPTDTTTPGGTPWVTTPAVDQQKRDIQADLDAKNQSDLVEKYNKDVENIKSLQTIKDEISAKNTANQHLQSQETLDRASQQLNALKQSTAFLWVGWSPGVSSAHMEALTNQVTMAQTTFDRLKQIEQNKDDMDRLWLKYDTQTFAKNMADMQYQLDQQVGTATQNAINQLNAQGGKIDSLDELDKVIGSIKTEMDWSIANIAQSNIAQRKKIMDMYNDGIKEAQDKATVDSDLSSKMWFMVNKFWDAKLDAQGNKIVLDKKAPHDPIIDEKSGQIVTFTSWPNGELIPKVNKLAGRQWQQQAQNEWKQDSKTWGFYRTWANGELETKGASSTSTSTTIDRWQQISDIKNLIGTDTSNVWISNWVAQIPDNTKWWQCGYGMNNVAQAMWLPKLFGDTLASKTNQINNGKTPVQWWFVVMDIPWSKTWHVWFVQSINQDWSLTIKDTNWNNDEQRITHNISANDPKIKWFVDINKKLNPMQWQEDKWPQTTQWSVDNSIASQIANYKLNNTQLSVYRKDPDKREQIMKQVQQINPNRSDSEYQNNNKTITQYWPSGKIWLSLKSLNTVMWHLWSYLDAINKYNGNTAEFLNKWANAIWGKFGGTENSVLRPVANNIWDETAKFFGWGSSSAWDREERTKQVDPDATPTQAKEFVRSQLDQLWSQTRTWNEQYKEVTGKYKDWILTPNAKEQIMNMNKKFDLWIKLSDITWNPADDEWEQNKQQSQWMMADLYNKAQKQTTTPTTSWWGRRQQNQSTTTPFAWWNAR